MIDFLCKLWPYLAGGLIGWLLAGWLARRFKYSKPPIEKIVEKQIDNPQHLALISKLESENKEIAGLKTKLSGFQSSTAVESTTKAIDNPLHLKRISELEAQVSTLKSSINSTPQAVVPASTKTVDNDAVHFKRISELEAQVNNLKSVLKTNSTVQSARSNSTPDVSKVVDNPEHVKRIKELEAQVNTLQQAPKIDLIAAEVAGFKLKNADDLTAIEGIGSKINDLIKAGGVKSFSQLANAPLASIQTVLDNADSRFETVNPETWPDQANLAANNRWAALSALQDVLVGGIYPNASAKSAISNLDGSNKNSVLNKTEIIEKPIVRISAVSSSQSPLIKPKAVVETKETSVDKEAGFKVETKEGRDDFTIVEGIGPKINDLIHNEGIHTYAALGKTKVEAIQVILEAAGPRYKSAKPGTWPAQADMAAVNNLEGLKAWQDELVGGK